MVKAGWSLCVLAKGETGMSKDRAMEVAELLCAAVTAILNRPPVTPFSLDELPVLATALRSRLMQEVPAFAKLPPRQRPALVLYVLETTLGLWKTKIAGRKADAKTALDWPAGEELRRLLDDAIGEMGQQLVAKLREPGVIR